MRAVSALVAILFAAFPAAAQQGGAQPGAASPPPEIVLLRAFVNSPDYVATTARVALEGDRDLAPECATTKSVARVGFVIVRPPVFQDGNPVPVAGAWKDQIKLDRCGVPVVHNVLVSANPTGLPAIGLALPGETALSPRLQQAAVADVLKHAGTKLKCKTAEKGVIMDTSLDKVVVQPKRNAAGLVVEGKWIETWTAKVCDKTLAVKMEMAADGQGAATHKVLTK